MTSVSCLFWKLRIISRHAPSLALSLILLFSHFVMCPLYSSTCFSVLLLLFVHIFWYSWSLITRSLIKEIWESVDRKKLQHPQTVCSSSSRRCSTRRKGWIFLMTNSKAQDQALHSMFLLTTRPVYHKGLAHCRSNVTLVYNKLASLKKTPGEVGITIFK